MEAALNGPGTGQGDRMNVPLGLRPVGADGWTATLVPQRPRPRETPPWDNAAQLILAVLLVPTALALAIGRTLWRRPVFLVAVVMLLVLVP